MPSRDNSEMRTKTIYRCVKKQISVAYEHSKDIYSRQLYNNKQNCSSLFSLFVYYLIVHKALVSLK